MKYKLFERAFDACGDLFDDLCRKDIMERLSDSSRYWHGIAHHSMMLSELFRRYPDGNEIQIVSILFHDLVYDATSQSNEDESAELAESFLYRKRDSHFIEMVLNNIDCSKHHVPQNAVEREFCQLDLWVFRQSAAAYAFYATGIRKEYKHIPSELYQVGRAGVLRKLRPSLLRVLDNHPNVNYNIDWEINILGTV